MTEALADRITEVLGDDAGELTTLAGGHSGLTYTVPASVGRCVVKAVPPGRKPLGRNDILRQATVLRALVGSRVPVPGVVAVDEREPAWFAMEFVPGDAIEPVLDDPFVAPELARARMLDLADVLRGLHDIDVNTLAIPPQQPTGATEELARWSATMHAVPEELRPGADELLLRLGEDVPADLPPVLLHGDFRLGNALCVGERTKAVVDWEIWSVGDRRVDLGWFLLFADHRNFPALGKPVPGLPTEAELLAAYGAELPAMPWFAALCRMKMAAIMGHNLRRHREGTHHDPDQERLPPTIAAMIATALAMLNQDS